MSITTTTTTVYDEMITTYLLANFAFRINLPHFLFLKIVLFFYIIMLNFENLPTLIC